jgi:myo-inositol-1(or 4)-monophosphatase
MNAISFDPVSCIYLAVSAARSASIPLLDGRIASREVRDSSDRDLKLSADLQAETVILDHLSKRSKYPVVSEEAYKGENLSEFAGPYWIVDPLDGTYNFGRKIGFCCVSIALWSAGEPLLGVVYDFNRDIMYEGVVGCGAYSNGVRIEVAQPVKSEQAVLLTGLPVAGDFSTRGIEAFSARIIRFKKVRLLGSAALSLALVSSGSSDVYYERGIRIWDVAAGLALVISAGGCFSVDYCDNEKTICNVSAGSCIESMRGLNVNYLK